MNPVNPFVDLPEYQRLTPFQQDLKYYLYCLTTAHYNPYANVPRAEFDRLAAQLHEELATVTEPMWFMAMLKQFAARLGDGHVNVFDHKIGQNLRFPLDIRWFPEGWFVHGIAQEHANWIGAKVERINGLPVDEVVTRLMTVISAENIYYKRCCLSDTLAFPGNLQVLDIAAPDGRLHLQLRLHDEVNEIILEMRPREELQNFDPGTMTFYHKRIMQRWLLPDDHLGYIQFNHFYDRRTAFPEDPRKDTLPDWGHFLEETFAEIALQDIRTLVLDLRYNEGGNSVLGDQFLYCLKAPENLLGVTVFHNYSEICEAVRPEYDLRGELAEQLGIPRDEVKFPYRQPLGPAEPREEAFDVYFENIINPAAYMHIDRPEHPFDGQVIILTGYNTFSSATFLAMMGQDNGLATIYGCPTGGQPSGFGDCLSFRLPNSQLFCSTTWRYYRRPDPRRDPADSLYPDVEVPQHAAAYFSGRDEVWERVLADVRREKVSKPRRR